MGTTKKLRYKYLSFAAGLLCILIGLLVILGWYVHNQQLISVATGYNTTKFNTALCLIMLGKAVVVKSVHFFKQLKGIGYLSAVIALCIGALSLSEMIGGVINIDELFIKDTTGIVLYPGRMSAITALSICFIATALLISDSDKLILIKISQYLLHSVTLVSFIALLGYIFSVPPLYSFSISTPMSLLTCVCMFCISCGASLLNYKYGITALFTGERSGNIMARNLFLKIAALMICISYLDIYTERHKVMSSGMSSALFSITVIFLSFIFIWETSKTLNTLEQRKEIISEKLNLIFEALPNALVMGSSDGKIILVNREAEKMFGYSRDELLGEGLEILLPYRLRKGHPAKMKSFFTTPFTRNFTSEANLYAMRKNGEEFPIEIGLTPVKTEEGLIGLATVVDITNRKISEKIIADQLRELKIKNQEMEQFNYIASHDLQEPLRTVVNYITLLEEDFNEKINEEISVHLTAMKQATTRMSRLIKTVLDYGLLGRNKKLVKTNINLIINEVTADLHNLIQTSQARVHIKTTMPQIYVYETELRQLFQNLINNAIKFRRKDSKPIINVDYNFKDGVHEFSVSDNGIGINSRHYKNIFNIFQRVNREEEYEGYGVGLANCKKIAEMHGGKIWVESVYGQGSTFKFTITNLRP